MSTVEKSLNPEQVESLRVRLNKADLELKEMAKDAPAWSHARNRLIGKAQGVRLALSYLEETLRDPAIYSLSPPKE